MKIYLAGKIKSYCWRHKIVDGLEWALQRDFKSHDESCYSDRKWPILEKSIFGLHDYVGPFFSAGGEHAHGNNKHGLQLYYHEKRWATSIRCLRAIDESDLVFAWLDDPSAYGTLAELGYAKGIGRNILVASPNILEDLWFAYAIADEISAEHRTAIEALQAMLGIVNLATMPYQDYLKTDHWQTIRKAELKNADYRCRICYADAPLDVHHRTYKRRGSELPNDVIALCRVCHAKFHDKPVAQLEYAR